MPPELPGAKQWYASTVGVIPSANWSDFEGGMVRFADGTVWAFMTKLDDYAAADQNGKQGTIFHMMIFEMLPDQSGWEQVTPDNWSLDDNFYTPDTVPQAGSIEQYPFEGSQSTVHYPGTGPWVYLAYDDAFLVRINNATRLYEVMNRPSDNNTLWENSIGWGYLFTIDDDYLWYLSSYVPVTTASVSRLVRKSLTPPYGEEIVTEWNTVNVIGDGNPGFWERDSTGLPYGAYDDVFRGEPNDGTQLANDDNYLYFFWSNEQKPVVSEPSLEGTVINWQEKTLTTLKRCSKTVPYTLETLLWGDLQRSSDRYSEDRGAYGFDQDFGAFPIYTGILAGQNARGAVRDGWLYWLDYGSEFNTGASVWRAGSQFRRINLDMFENNKPIKLDPENPPFEILSNASANFESHARTNYYANRVTHWRDGAYPLHSATGGGSWYFEDDGSIVFMHREFDEILYYDNTRTWWPIMRLTPPDSANNTFQVSLIFEGNALKGYGPVHQHPASYVPEEVFLQ